MAAPIDTNVIFIILSFISIFNLLSSSASYVYQYESKELTSVLENGCFIGASIQTDHNIMAMFTQLTSAFLNEPMVTVGIVNLAHFIWPNGQSLKIDGRDCKITKDPLLVECTEGFPDIVFIPKKDIDRNCLLSTSYPMFQPAATAVTGMNTFEQLLNFVNAKCHTFRRPDGGQLPAGLHREYILNNMYNVSQVSDINMKKLQSSNLKFLKSLTNQKRQSIEDYGVCHDDKCENIVNPSHYSHDSSTTINYDQTKVEVPKCDYIEYSDLHEENFFHKYLKRSQPVVIRNALNQWPAQHNWSADYLREQYGNRTVHVKLTPGGDFEGVENLTLWENYDDFKIPDKVKDKLPYPDLVVVRPAGIQMNFSEFLDLIEWAAEQPARNVSAYLEYSSIPEYMPELQEDLSEFIFVKNKLTLRHLNMWLSDGNTLGRLHFDPFDNFLCQLRGKKQVTMFEPFDNSKLYEGHIQQATLSYNRSDHSFRRQTLEDSTSMVMSPVDLLNPDFERFPEFASAQPLNCTINEGDVLFMPSFWWHEVYSWPNTQEKRNLAVNFWYEPFLSREFPCPDCKMDVNPYYHHLLY